MDILEQVTGLEHLNYALFMRVCGASCDISCDIKVSVSPVIPKKNHILKHLHFYWLLLSPITLLIDMRKSMLV